MSIGPDAANIAPGRIVVTIAYFITLGGFAIVVGIGPLLMPAAGETKLLGALACVCGVVLVLGGIGLMVRTRAGRTLAIAAARSALILAVVGVALGAVTVIDVIDSPSVGAMSAAAGALVVLASLANGLFALASLRGIYATRRRYFREEGHQLDPTAHPRMLRRGID